MWAELLHADGRTDGQTDMTEPIVSFHNFANAPNKKKIFFPEWETAQSYSSRLNFAAVESGDMEQATEVSPENRSIFYLFLFIYCFHLFVFSPPSSPLILDLVKMVTQT